jgi:YHS domain-containing protein
LSRAIALDTIAPSVSARGEEDMRAASIITAALCGFIVGCFALVSACERAPTTTTTDDTTPVATAAEAAVVGDEGSCGSAHAHAPPTAIATFESAPAAGTLARCVVMDRDFTVLETTPTSTYAGKTYAFCCDGCKELFDKDPATYAQKAAALVPET